MLLEKDIVGLAMENNTAFVESDGERYFIRSSKEAQAFLIQYQAGGNAKKECGFQADLEKMIFSPPTGIQK